jgi:hypothetical protein
MEKEDWKGVQQNIHMNLKIRKIPGSGIKVINPLRFLCGVDDDGRINRSVLWSMLSALSTLILLIFAYFQIRDVNQTNSAEFSHKIKNDLYTPENIRLITLFDDDLLRFESDSNNFAWFVLDTLGYNKIPHQVSLGNIPTTYNVFEMDELLQDFEDLAFYNKKNRVQTDYIYIQFAYYIEMLWENKSIANYVKWQRGQEHSGYSYRYLEELYKKMKAISDKQP